MVRCILTEKNSKILSNLQCITCKQKHDCKTFVDAILSGWSKQQILGKTINSWKMKHLEEASTDRHFFDQTVQPATTGDNVAC